jgi:hypothetical protein
MRIEPADGGGTRVTLTFPIATNSGGATKME